MNLYEKIDIKDFETLLVNDESFMSYCPSCTRETTFKRSEWYSRRIESVELEYIFNQEDKINKIEMLELIFGYDESQEDSKSVFNKGRLLIKEYECCINSNHRKYEIFYKDEENDKIIKIGQYPSEYDIGSKEYLDKLKVVCGTKEAREMVKFINKALVMESFGYGIPALLYMRRSFERLINISEDKNELKNTGTTMSERIQNNPLLPQEFKENKRIYNIISEGIHNETEEECMELFKVIKVGFTILLRKTYEYVQEQKDIEELKNLVSSK